MRTRKRGLWTVVVFFLVALGLAFGGMGRPASAQQPITISILDNGGDLASTGVIIENYKKAFPNKVKEIKIQRGPAPETPAKIKAQQDAGRVDIHRAGRRVCAGGKQAAHRAVSQV
jgi:ABC-type glycerol-3-phosphate transport system substrate-binding protein